MCTYIYLLSSAITVNQVRVPGFLLGLPAAAKFSLLHLFEPKIHLWWALKVRKKNYSYACMIVFLKYHSCSWFFIAPWGNGDSFPSLFEPSQELWLYKTGDICVLNAAKICSLIYYMQRGWWLQYSCFKTFCRAAFETELFKSTSCSHAQPEEWNY